MNDAAIKRDEKGRLLPGHGLKSPGRPRREHEARYQKIVYSALTEEAVFKAASKLVELAEQGDVAAIREILRLVLPRVPDPFELIEGDDSAPDAQA